jgi:ribosome-associated translation inhibitor RaiA
MKLPLMISFRHMDRVEALETLIRQKAAKLETFAGDITRCRVVVEPAGQHHLHGYTYRVHVQLTLPGGEIDATGDPVHCAEHRDVAVALRDVFDSTRRQLQDYIRRRRGAVKTHASEVVALTESGDGQA